MQAEESLHATKNRKRLKREQKLKLRKQRNWLVQFEELTERINPTVSVLQSNDQRDRTSREKLENSRKVVSKEIVCFKIIKLVYNDSIYTKIF